MLRCILAILLLVGCSGEVSTTPPEGEVGVVVLPDRAGYITLGDTITFSTQPGKFYLHTNDYEIWVFNLNEDYVYVGDHGWFRFETHRSYEAVVDGKEYSGELQYLGR